MNEHQIDEQHQIATRLQKFIISKGYNTRLSTTNRDGYMFIKLFEEDKKRKLGIQLGIGPAPHYRVTFVYDSTYFRDTLSVTDTDPFAKGGFADRIATHATRAVQIYTDLARLLKGTPWAFTN